MVENTRTVKPARATSNCSCPVCALFCSRDGECKVPFIKDGSEAGGRVTHIIDKDQRTERLQRLADTGANVASAQASGRLELRPWEAPLYPVLSKYNMDILRTHPLAIVGGVLWENPFHLPPDVLLRELKERPALLR